MLASAAAKIATRYAIVLMLGFAAVSFNPDLLKRLVFMFLQPSSGRKDRASRSGGFLKHCLCVSVDDQYEAETLLKSTEAVKTSVLVRLAVLSSCEDRTIYCCGVLEQRCTGHPSLATRLEIGWGSSQHPGCSTFCSSFLSSAAFLVPIIRQLGRRPEWRLVLATSQDVPMQHLG